MLLNWVADSPKITPRLSELIEAERNTIFFSPLSIWEARIKWARRRLELPDDFVERIRSMDFAELTFSSLHADEAGRLPAIHSDPFDRGLIAQARIEGLTLLTNDRLLARYEVKLEFG